MKLTSIALALTLSATVMMTPGHAVDVRTIHLSTAQENEQGGTTRVKILQDGVELDDTFTPEELADRDLLQNRLAALPEEKREKIITMLQQVGSNKLIFDFDTDFGMDDQLHEEFIELAEEFEREHGEKMAVLEVRAQEMAKHAHELQAKAHVIAAKVEKKLQDANIHEHVKIITQAVDDGILLELDKDSDGNIMVFKEIVKPSMAEHIVSMLEDSKLSDADRQRIQEALDQAQHR